MTTWSAQSMSATGETPERQDSHGTVATSWRGSLATGLERNDLVFLGALLIGALWIWVRDLAWLQAAEETLPVLAALPIFIWLGSPWRFKTHALPLRWQPVALSASLAGVGLVMDLTILLSAAWTVALWTWIGQRVDGDVRLLRRLALLPFLAFPWVALDLAPVGWWFRLSASWMADHAYSAAGFTVLREGTNLIVGGIPIEVAAPCSGMNSLQAILLGGLVLTWIEFGKSRSYWWIVTSLPVLAWVANTCRVFSIIAMAVGLSPDAARGSLHQIGGWIVVLAVIFAWSLVAKSLAGFQKRAALGPEAGR